MNTRAAAVQILGRLPYPYRQYEQVVRRYLAEHAFSQADSDFINLLVRGVIVYQQLLDFVLAQSLRRPVKKLETTALLLLRIGAFQKVVLRLPAHAVVNETVEATRQLERPDLAGLVNGVLRHLPEEESWRSRLAQLAPVEALAVEYSHPRWLIERWLANFGWPATRQLLAFDNTYQEIIWRHNPLRLDGSELIRQLTAEGYHLTLLSEEPTLFFTVDDPGRLLKSQLFQAGLLSVQDYSQALAVQLLAPQAGETVLDVCAAPGGKTTYIAQLTNDQAQVLAFDLSAQRLKQLATETKRLGITSITCQQADARKDSFPTADKILIDAPCSGTGVIARRANLRWNRTATDLTILPREQQAILQNVARYLRTGGALVYCTCSIEPEENWAIIEEFVNRHPAFVVEPADKYLARQYCDAMGAVQILPFRHNFTGSFAVRLVKTGNII